MAWKPKERTLTLEEAIALARKEYAPHWRNTPFPLVAGTEGKLHPLDESIRKKVHIFGVFDCFSFSAQQAVGFLKYLLQTYAEHSIYPIAVLTSPRAIVMSPKVLDSIAAAFKMPVCFDHDGELQRALAFPLSHQNHFACVQAQIAESDPEQFEVKLQAFLRTTDPGLPLKPPAKTPLHGATDLFRISLSRDGLRVKAALDLGLKLSGEWEITEDCIRPLTTSCTLEFRYQPKFSPNMGLVASSTKITRIGIDLGTTLLPPEWFGRDVSTDENGKPSITIPTKGLDRVLYEVIRDAEMDDADTYTVRITIVEPLSTDLRFYRLCLSRRIP